MSHVSQFQITLQRPFRALRAGHSLVSEPAEHYRPDIRWPANLQSIPGCIFAGFYSTIASFISVLYHVCHQKTVFSVYIFLRISLFTVSDH